MEKGGEKRKRVGKNTAQSHGRELVKLREEVKWQLGDRIDSKFCLECGALLRLPPPQGPVACPYCHHASNVHESIGKVIVTKSKKKKTRKHVESVLEHRSKIAEVCPQCNHGEMYFSTAQLRSADEGQTIFFECVACSHRFVLHS